jgi:hypothetical protein
VTLDGKVLHLALAALEDSMEPQAIHSVVATMMEHAREGATVNACVAYGVEPYCVWRHDTKKAG